MAIQFQYKSLFSLDVLHHFFLSGGPNNEEFGAMSANAQAAMLKDYRLENLISIQPDQQTIQQIRNLKQLYRPTAMGFNLLASVDENDEPTIELAEGDKWTFALLINDPSLLNYTALRLAAGFDATDLERNAVPRIFYFSNANAGITAPNISRDVPAFNGATPYRMNDLVLHGGDLYEAATNTPPGPTPDAANSGWLQVNRQSYITSLDELRYRSSFFDYKFTAPGIWAAFDLKNRDGVTLARDHGQSSADNLFHPINMSPYAPGRYQLDVDGNGYSDSQQFYYHPEFVGKALFGIVEIFHQPGLAVGLRLLDGSGQVEEPSFELRFKNRMTQWRYKDSTDQSVIAGITGIDDPLPLTKTGFISSVARNTKVLPNPHATMIRSEADAIYSDVFIDSSQYP
ncbi:MAG: hypothetical protein AAF990_02685 [Bacteroidota bacterium]